MRPFWHTALLLRVVKWTRGWPISIRVSFGHLDLEGVQFTWDLCSSTGWVCQQCSLACRKYNVVIYIYSRFIQIFLWDRYSTLALKSME